MRFIPLIFLLASCCVTSSAGDGTLFDYASSYGCSADQSCGFFVERSYLSLIVPSELNGRKERVLSSITVNHEESLMFECGVALGCTAAAPCEFWRQASRTTDFVLVNRTHTPVDWHGGNGIKFVRHSFLDHTYLVEALY